ncbi:hypothetical protein P615_15600 [Brevibacillus laterosporus PE36]|nr:hypothetical protein P615_15600 [Brevibacillus laterosporus PE36]
MKEFLLKGYMFEGVATRLLVIAAAAAYDYQQNEQH